MNPLAESLVRILQTHPAVKNVRIVSYDETPAGKLELKIRRGLVRDYKFQVWLHHEPEFQDYAYQLDIIGNKAPSYINGASRKPEHPVFLKTAKHTVIKK